MFDEESPKIESEIQKNPKEILRFRPLGHPSLIQELAEKALGEMTEDDILDFANEYGTLGLQDIDSQAHLSEGVLGTGRGGLEESVETFRGEAETALEVLQTYEALTYGGGPDEEELRDLLGHPYATTFPELVETAARRTVQRVSKRLRWFCYPHQFDGHSGWFLGYGFNSLLGAMYLQLAWLMDMSAVPRKCKRPECNGIVFPEQKQRGRPQEFCSNRCKNNWHSKNRPERRGDDH